MVARAVSTGSNLSRRFEPFAPPPGALARTRLLARLDGALSRRLTLLVADSGYGKTTLISQWSSTLPQIPQAWYPLQSGDAQPRIFEQRLTAMLAHLAPMHRVTRSIDRALDAIDDHSLVVLDDAHLLSDRSQGLLSRLLEHPLLHLVATSRAPLTIPLARLRVQGQILELGPADLAFTPEEIAAVGIDADPREVWGQTGGWPAAMALVRFGGSVPAAGSRAELFNLLVEEVWSKIDTDEQEVLEVAALAGDPDSALVVDVSGHAHAPAVLASFTGRGWLTLTAEDRYSCHPLFREFVLRRMPVDAREGIAARVLARRTANQEWTDAAAVSVYCGRSTRWEFARRHGSAVSNHGGATALRQILEELPYDPTEPARLTVLRGRLDNMEGNFSAALRWLSLGEARAEAEGDWGTLAHAAATRADAFAHRGEYAQAADACRTALARIDGRDDAAQAELESILPWSLYHLGEFDEAVRILDRALQQFRQQGNVNLEALCLRRRGAFHSMRGELSEALRYETQALVKFQQAHVWMGEANTRSNLGVTLGRAGRFGEAQAQEQAALTLAERHGFAGMAQQIRLELAALSAASSGPVELQQPVLESERETFLWHLVFARNARRRGEFAQAWQAIGAARALREGLPPIFHRRLDAEEGAVLLAEGGLEQAAQPLDAAVEGLWNGPWRVESYLPRLHRAWANLQRVHHEAARADLDVLLAWRTQADLRSLWAQETWAAVPVLQFARQANLEGGFVASLLASLTAELPETREPAVRIKILGPMRIAREGRSLSEAFERPQARALLAYLAVHHPRPVPAGELLDALWPRAGSVEESSLYTTVSRLRRALGREFIVKDGMGYRLDASVEVDTRVFDAALTADPPRWKDATVLYRGELLADLPLAEWCFIARDTYRSRFLDAATRYGESALAREDLREARAAFEQALEVELLHEPAVQGLMRTLMLSGNAPGALQFFQRFTTRLERELGVAPGEDTVRLAERIRAAGDDARPAPA